jgi:hypothetical protein
MQYPFSGHQLIAAQMLNRQSYHILSAAGYNLPVYGINNMVSPNKLN